MEQNWLPDYIDVLPTIELIDHLGAFLNGISDPEPVEYSFADVVKQSGHACPSIAGAYGIVYEALAALYPNEIPVRGEIAVVCPESQDSGAMGPISQAITYLTGACADNGFHGLAGQFDRTGLLSFNGEEWGAPFKFTRTDTNKSVTVTYHSNRIPGDPIIGTLMQKALSGMASPQEKKAFGTMWQERVRYVLEKEENRKVLFEVVEL